MDRKDGAIEHSGLPRAQGELGLPEQSHEGADIRCRTLRQRDLDVGQGSPCVRDNPAKDLSSLGIDRRVLRLDDGDLFGLAQRGPARHLDDEGKAVRQRGVERLRAEIAVILVIARRRVHRGPAIAEPFERQSLYPPLVDDREQLVLDVRPAAADLVEDDGARPPDRRRGLHILEFPVLPRQREAHEIVEIEEARIVVPGGQPERRGNPGQQQGFGGAVRTDEEKRLFRRKRSHQYGREGVEPLQPKCPEGTVVLSGNDLLG